MWLLRMSKFRTEHDGANIPLKIVTRCRYKTPARKHAHTRGKRRQFITKMSLQIISVLPVHEAALVSPLTPPLPSDSLPEQRKALSENHDQESGFGSLSDGSYFDDLPGCNISDDEFNESFLASPATSSRSSLSDGLAIVTAIPEPPPPPPIQFHVLRMVRSTISELDRSRPYGTYGDCIICLDTTTLFTTRPCCQKIVCQICLARMIQTRLDDGLIQFPCPNPDCSEPVTRMEAIEYLDNEAKERFERLRVNAESSGDRKTCPHCCHITQHKLPSRTALRKFREEDVKIQCENCSIEWCFKCHAPWHQDVTCKAYMRGNRHFQKWTRDRPNGVANCQKCPTCRVFIQRSTGCDHMTCNRCGTHFCYKCGGRFIEVPGLGDHYQRTSVLGCKYNYFQDDPIKRKTIRGGYFGAKMAMLTGYPVLFVAGVAVVVVVGAVGLPIYGGYRLYKLKKNANKLRRRRRRH